MSVKTRFSRYRCPCNPDSFSYRYNELLNYIRKKNWFISGNFIAIFYDPYTEFNYDDADIEVCIPIRNPEQDNKNIRIMPRGQYLSYIHKGPYSETFKSHSKMLEWLSQNNYELTGSVLEIYLINSFYTKNEKNYITELQYPVRKIKSNL